MKDQSFIHGKCTKCTKQLCVTALRNEFSPTPNSLDQSVIGEAFHSGVLGLSELVGGRKKGAAAS